MTGCNKDHPIIEEMLNAERAASSQKNSSHVERDAATALVVQKYFPIGIKKKDALAQLNILKENDFEIVELKYEGERVWPNGKFRKYSGELEGLNHERRFPIGTTGYIAEKTYDKKYIIVTFTAVISIKLDRNDVVVESKGSVYGDGP